MTTDQQKTVLFVCPHGAAKSRMAAAFFNQISVSGWHAVSAGTEPQEAVSVHPARLLQGEPSESFLDHEAPRPVSAVPDAALVVAIDCPSGDLLGAVRWELANREFNEDMREEIRDRVAGLAGSLGQAGQQ